MLHLMLQIALLAGLSLLRIASMHRARAARVCLEALVYVSSECGYILREP
jgi:hypothetical protein